MAKSENKFSKLKSEAMSGCEFRQHVMSRWTELHPGVASTTCINCGAGVVVDLKPQPNGIDIGGEAVAMNCRITPMLGKATHCIKVIPFQSKPFFVYVDATSEEDALAMVPVQPDDFMQVGVFYTDVELHQVAKVAYESK
jgi:hypothetical protein